MMEEPWRPVAPAMRTTEGRRGGGVEEREDIGVKLGWYGREGESKIEPTEIRAIFEIDLELATPLPLPDADAATEIFSAA